MSRLFDELKRRNVVRVGVAYVVVGWLLMQAAGALEPALLLPDWVDRVVAVFLMIGFPIVLIFAWAFEITPEGIKPTSMVNPDESITTNTGKKLEHTIIALLVVALLFMGAREFLSGDDESAGRGASAFPASIAVLPFEDYSEERDQEHFSKGIAEEILNLLAKTNSLRVAARTSSFAFAGSDLDIREIGEKLEVGTVLEGSIRKSGPNIRITAQLINVEDGYHLWSETYDRDYTDIFRIQDEIATSILASLRVYLLGDEEPLATAAAERTINMDAYDAYLIGKERLAKRTEEDIDAAIAKFEQAIAVDPNFAPARVDLVHALLLSERYVYGGNISERDEIDAALLPHLGKALELAPESPEAIAVSGLHHLSRFRYKEAAEAFDKALALNPNYAEAYNWRAETAYEQDRFLDMLADKEKAFSLDPMSLQISADLAFEYRSFWRPKDAERVIERMFELHPDHPLAYGAALENLTSHGRYGEALLLAEQALESDPESENFKGWRGWLLTSLGMVDEAKDLGNEFASFYGFLAEKRFDEAKAILDQELDSEDAELWYGSARDYYLLSGENDVRPKLDEYVELEIAAKEARNLPWRERCDIYLAFALQDMNRPDDYQSIMGECRRKMEERLKAGYFCPCSYFSLVLFTIVDGRLEEGIERADQWLNNGDSSYFLQSEPIFRLLKDQPEYDELIARNAEQIERQKQIYLSGLANNAPAE
jgi:TolB-like protein/Flp pilus assembly protein TadD